MKKDLTHIIIVLDRSGSMSGMSVSPAIPGIIYGFQGRLYAPHHYTRRGKAA